MPTKKILLVTGDAGETYEVLYAKHRFEEAGYESVIAAPRKKSLNLVVHDFAPGWDTYIEKAGYLVPSDIAFDKVKTKDYVAVNILGGRAPEYLRHDANVVRIVKEFAAQKKPIFAVCHGIQVMIAAGICAGKKVTCYEHVRSEVECNGGTWIGKQAVRDGNIVTAQTWQSHPDYYRAIFDVLEGR